MIFDDVVVATEFPDRHKQASIASRGLK